MRTIAIENLKGGVGKTVTTISLAHILVEDYHKQVLVVDCDGQCNLTRFYLGRAPDAPTLAEVLTGEHEPYWQDNVLSVRPGLWLLPASQELYRLIWRPSGEGPPASPCCGTFWRRWPRTARWTWCSLIARRASRRPPPQR